ncbi:ABC transporter ATP-binding protein [Vibrio sp.]|nr:ABC transporter ATP-binding protein [Vibrio sp.]
MTTALSIKNLTCKYGDQTILKSLSLDVESGEIVCLLGASGCGKTTLLKAFAGLLPLDSGHISLNDRLIDDGHTWLPPEKRNIGMIFQDYALFPHLTVEQNVKFGLHGWSKEAKAVKVQEMLELVHLSGFESRYPHQLSGGQQQRVAIARALAYGPDLLLLDEPFSNIDTQVRHGLIQEIRSIFKKQGVTAIFVTHSREEAFAFADKMAVMNHGVIEQFGSSSELYFKPSSKFVADFLGGGSYLPAKRISDTDFESTLGTFKATTQADIGMGDLCDLLIRPQQFHAEPLKQGEVNIRTHFKAKVTEQLFMGDHCRYTVKASGYDLTVTSHFPLLIEQDVIVSLEGEQSLLAFEHG